jgi:AcrR family transcriptional regulator
MDSSPRRKPRQDGLRTRAALIAAAQELFGQSGIDAPLDTIARRAGVANATLYRHFPQRVDLIVEVLILALRRGEIALAEGSRQANKWQGFTAYLTWIFAEQVHNRAYMGGLRAVPTGTNAEIDELRNATVAGLEQLIDGAKHEGSFRADRWTEDVFLFMALNEQMARTGLQDLETGSNRFLELCLGALSSPEPGGPSASTEPDAVLVLRRTLGHEIAGLPYGGN